MVKAKILVIGDEPGALSQVSKWLRESEFEVIESNNTEEALRLLKEGLRPNLIAVDIHMAVLNSYQFCRDLRKDKETILIPLLFLTTRRDDNEKISVLRLGVDDYLGRPFIQEELLARANNIIERVKIHGHRGRQRRDILAIGASPGDIELGIIGTLIRHREEGDNIHMLTLSYGRRMGESYYRIREVEKAAEQIGAQCHFFDLLSSNEVNEREIEQIINQIIEKTNARLIYVQTIYGRRYNDQLVSRLVSEAVAEASIDLFAYRTPFASTSFHPNRLVDISLLFEEKLEAIRCHQTLVQRARRATDIFNEEVIRFEAMYWGRFIHCHYAEPLQILKLLQ